jgi:hypothetical protein
MASSGVQMVANKRTSQVYTEPVPVFQALPSSITSAKLVQPTKVEYYPKELPEVDLKGHTVEELAAAANVSVDVIKAAIKLRQQQLQFEQKPSYKKKFLATTSAIQTTQSTTTTPEETTTTEKETTQFTTSKPSTTPYVPKKKVTKKVINNGHKVMN